MRPPSPRGFTIVEMLIGMAITLIMMLAVVTMFANITNSMRNRRATIEMTDALRHTRNLLQRDLAGATCTALPWQRPESNRGYIEIIEGLYSDQYPSMYTDGNLNSENNAAADGVDPDELDAALSLVPRYSEEAALAYVQRDTSDAIITTVNGLGDHDDIVALTTRNEDQPFVGRVPDRVRNGARSRLFPEWADRAVTSPLAETIWFAVENPMLDTGRHMGEPGLRTIYRRVLLVAPWLSPYHDPDLLPGQPDLFTEPAALGGATFEARPGLLRVLGGNLNREHLPQALASLIAFQERYDVSARLEFNPALDNAAGDPSEGRWQIVANTLGDLTKRENRFEHYQMLNDGTNPPARQFPFAMVSGVGSADGVRVVLDPELIGSGTFSQPQVTANEDPRAPGSILSYWVDPADRGSPYPVRPFVYVLSAPATARAVLDASGNVAHVVRGLAPLSGARLGQDVVLSDALAFDLSVYDPGAPLYPEITDPTDPNYPGRVLEPSDPGWGLRAVRDNQYDGMPVADGHDPIGRGAYVDLGYWFAYAHIINRRPSSSIPMPAEVAVPQGPLSLDPSISGPYPRPRSVFPYLTSNKSQFLSGTDFFRVYDTWSLHYENNGLNEDGDGLIDEGVNGFDDDGVYGPDDVGERETAPPYDAPLRGVQVRLRVYERDSRQIREVTVRQHFVPE